MESEELMELFMPILCADFAMLEKYNYADTSYKLPSEVSLFFGRQDQWVEKMKKWDEVTVNLCNIYAFEGNHFFIHNVEVVEKINRIVLGL